HTRSKRDWSSDVCSSDLFVQAAVAASATERVVIGTDIALAFPRSPTITAMAARDLAELSGGRFVLGLGTQVKRVNEQRFGIPFEIGRASCREREHSAGGE